MINVFDQLFKELKDLSKKKPEATLSETKVKIINRVLSDAKACLDNEPEHKYLDILDDDRLPQYGDAVLVFSQYEGALKAFKGRYWYYDYINSEHAWSIIEDDESAK